jgi:thioredoxin reductase (NADPH)
VDAVVIGAGPVGLACAIAAQRVGLSVRVIDKGALVNSFIGYPTHLEFFSTPELLEIGGHPFSTMRYKPVRSEAIDYYRRVASAEQLDTRLYERVEAVRGEEGAFEVVTSKGVHPARFVVVATGFFDVPNRLGVPGDDLPHVTHYYKEAYPYTGQRVAVIGAKNSAAKAALDCFRHGAHVTLVVRGEAISEKVKYWIKPDLENRIRDGAIDAIFGARVSAIEPGKLHLMTAEGARTLEADFVLAMTGYRPDYPLLARLGIETHDDDARTPVFDEDTHETNRRGVYLAGTVCGGLRTSRWFIENGRHHAEVIATAMAAQTANEAPV